jgi:hypothetical protein
MGQIGNFEVQGRKVQHVINIFVYELNWPRGGEVCGALTNLMRLKSCIIYLGLNIDGANVDTKFEVYKLTVYITRR